MFKRKIVTVIGTRPQIVKWFPVQQAMDGMFDSVLVETGQHYDHQMAGVFFSELGIPGPEYSLQVGSSSHGRQTADMLSRIEEVLLTEKPEGIIVFGDTNSTLAGALAASKLHCPVFHIEAGLRSYNRRMPEEQNRVITDHLSTLLFCPSEKARENLAAEGIRQGVHVVGDVMVDATLLAFERSKVVSTAIGDLNLTPKGFNLLTMHRAENTRDGNALQSVFAAVGCRNESVVFPIHPRTRKLLNSESVPVPENVILIEPLGYFDMLSLQHGARKVITDSGGIQKESYLLGTPCIVLREETEWTELVEHGFSVLTGTDSVRITRALDTFEGGAGITNLYGDGTASESICKRIQAYYGD